MTAMVSKWHILIVAALLGTAFVWGKFAKFAWVGIAIVAIVQAIKEWYS